MTNTKKEVNRHIFERLEKYLPKEEASVSKLKIGEGSIRYIATNVDSFAQLFLTEFKFGEFISTFDKAVLFTILFQDKVYLVITGRIDDPVVSFKGIEVVKDPDNIEQDFKNNPGLITALFSNEMFPISTDANIGYRLLENVFGREGKEDGKFDCTELLEFFSDFSVWELGENFKYGSINTLLAIYSGFLISNKKQLNLNFSDNLKQRITLLIEELPMDLIGGNVYRALLSMEWKHTFLELYQCIEYLFPTPYLMALSTNIGYPDSFSKLYQNTEIDLQWRPKEEQALERLFCEIEAKEPYGLLYDCLCRIFKLGNDREPDNKSGLIAKHIYQTRNSIAHFRIALKTGIKNETDWDEIITHLCGIIYELFKQYGPQISAINSANL